MIEFYFLFSYLLKAKSENFCNYFASNYLHIANKMRLVEEQYEGGLKPKEGIRGVYILPHKIEKNFYTKPSLNYFYENLAFQMFCRNLQGNL